MNLNRLPVTWLRVAAVGVVIACPILVFMPVLLAGYVFWDDYTLVVANARYQSLDDGGLAWMFSTSLAGHWQPLTWLSYWLDYQIAGSRPLTFHTSNLILHVAASLVFYFVARRILMLWAAKPFARAGRPLIVAAAFSTLLFSIHPLRVESVAWIAERRDVLSGVFILLAVWAWLRFAGTIIKTDQSQTGWPQDDPPCERGNATGTGSAAMWYCAAVVCFALSLGAKAAGVMLPLVFLVLDVRPLQRTTCPDRRRLRCWGHLLLEKVPFFALSAAAGVRAVIAQDRGGALFDLSRHGLADRLAQAVYGLAFYPAKTLWPFGLAPLYEIPPDDVLYGSGLVISGVALIVVVLIAAMLGRRIPALSVGLASYVLLLAPVLGLFQSGPQFVADRYSYLATMPLAILVGGGLFRLMQTTWWSMSGRGRALTALVCVAVLAGLGHRTLDQASYWRDDLSLWRHGVEVSPDSAISHTNLADAYARRGPEAFVPAERHYLIALQLNPRSAIALDHLARIYEMQGRNAEAIRLYVRALAIDPTRLQATLSLGELLAEAGRGAEAVAVWRTGLGHHPDSLRLLDALADILATFPDPGGSRRRRCGHPGG